LEKALKSSTVVSLKLVSQFWSYIDKTRFRCVLFVS